MTGVTPIYGIHYPDSATKAKNLGVELATMGADVERALQAAQIPPVTPAPVMVAASAAARDQYWGQPSTEAERLALQGRGATTLRTDLGREERYYATYNAATNPAGASPAGWYGGAEAARLTKSTAQNTGNANADTPVVWNADTLAGGLWNSANPTRLTIRIPGVYLVKVNLRYDTLASGEYGITRLRVNGVSLGNSEHLAAGGMPGGGYTVMSDTVRLLPGDYLEAIAISSPGTRAITAPSASMTVQRVGA